ncbi:MAG: transporter substrate-binding domain-containing protein [Planctomycetota bacterium]|jgi:polar amino acid transport system substrate-binding protein|nr:transporter substrate-binding domain-containing protein [Planctomycetota bacterium]
MKHSLLALIILVLPASAEKITTIKVATESWERATHKDGTGWYFDIVRKIYKPRGITMQHQIVPYTRSVMLVKTGKADLWLGSYEDEEKEALYPRTAYDLDIVVALFKNEKVKEWKGEVSITGKKVGWIKDYAYDQYLHVKVVSKEIYDRKIALRVLAAGRIDFFVDEIRLVNDAIKKHNFDKTGYGMENLLRLKLLPGFSNNARGKALRSIWEERMKEMHANGELKAFYKKNGVLRKYPFE